MTFDLYCYLYGSTIVAMLTLPPETLEGGIEATVERLKQLRHAKKKLEPAFANPRFPIHTIRLARACRTTNTGIWKGGTLPEAAELCKQSILDFVCDLLIATDLAAGCVVRHFAERQESDIIKLMKHPLMMAGSDGIYVGGKPTRGTGCFRAIHWASRP